MFLFGNILLLWFVFLNWENMFVKNAEYEKYTVETESYLLEILAKL
jgi:hypothetical protein